jgi:hypothetical protein
MNGGAWLGKSENPKITPGPKNGPARHKPESRPNRQGNGADSHGQIPGQTDEEEEEGQGSGYGYHQLGGQIDSIQGNGLGSDRSGRLSRISPVIYSGASDNFKASVFGAIFGVFVSAVLECS